MIRFSYLRVPSSDAGRPVPSLAIIPDGLEHSKYTSRKGGHSFYSLCLREAVDQFIMKQPYKRGTRESPLIPRKHLPRQVAHLLRLRVLQELEQLGERMRHQVRQRIRNGDPHTILRRLTREEFDSMESTRTAPFQNAIAVLVVPPVEAESSMSPLPPPEETPSKEPFPPLSVLMPISSGLQSGFNSLQPLGGLLPSPTVPVYNCLTAFPHPSQRAALRALLVRVLKLEQHRERLHKSPRLPPVESPSFSTDGSELSDAFVLCSDQENLRRGDAAAVAIALWRLRMFEGEDKPTTSSWSLGTHREVRKLL